MGKVTYNKDYTQGGVLYKEELRMERNYTQRLVGPRASISHKIAAQ